MAVDERARRSEYETVMGGMHWPRVGVAVLVLATTPAHAEESNGSCTPRPWTNVSTSFGGLAFIGPKDQPMVIGGLDVDVRHHGEGTYGGGGRMVLGTGTAPAHGMPTLAPGARQPQGFSLHLAPIIGLQVDRVPLPARDTSLPRCTYERYKTHLFGFEPSLWLAGGVARFGAQILWEYDRFDLDPPIRGVDDFGADLRLRSAFRAGYVLDYGAGGSWTGTGGWGYLHGDMTLGFYYQKSPSVLIGGSLGIWWS